MNIGLETGDINPSQRIPKVWSELLVVFLFEIDIEKIKIKRLNWHEILYWLIYVQYSMSLTGINSMKLFLFKACHILG